MLMSESPGQGSSLFSYFFKNLISGEDWKDVVGDRLFLYINKSQTQGKHQTYLISGFWMGQRGSILLFRMDSK